MFRRTFLGSILTSVLPISIKQLISSESHKKRNVLIKVISDDWFDVTIDWLKVSVIRVKQRGKLFTDPYTGSIYPWWKPDEWMVLTGNHDLIQGDDLKWIKSEACRLIEEIKEKENLLLNLQDKKVNCGQNP